MTIASDFSINSSGNLREAAAFVPGTNTRYNILDLHAWVQDLADNSGPTSDDNVSILTANPSELAGKRNSSRPMALTLLNGINIDDASMQWFKFGSIEQAVGNYLYTGLKVLGSLVTNSPIYITQSNAKITKYWADADSSNFQILVKAKTGSGLIDSGNITVFSRKYGQTYSHFDVNLAAGGEQAAALSTALDPNVDAATITPTVAKSYFSSAIGGTATPGTEKIALAYTDATHDLGGGSGSKLHKGTVTLDGTITVAQAYQALMWAVSESSTITFNAFEGWRYRSLDQARALGAGYAENIPAPFGSFAGGKWFVAQGWWMTGVEVADSKNYQLVSHDGTVEIPPSTVTVAVTGTVSGDYVLCGRDDGSGGLNEAEYTVSGSSGAGTVTVAGLKPDTPVSGTIRIDGDRYAYTSWTGTTVTLSGTLSSTYASKPAFIPFIDGVASGTSMASDNMQFDANFAARFRVRNGGGTPIVPFESTITVNSSGGSGTTVRNADA